MGDYCEKCVRRDREIRELQIELEESQNDIQSLASRTIELRLECGKSQAKIAELQSVIEQRDRKLALIISECTGVVANSRNTAAVKKGHELSGYTKYYKMPTHVMNRLKNEQALKDGD